MNTQKILPIIAFLVVTTLVMLLFPSTLAYPIELQEDAGSPEYVGDDPTITKTPPPTETEAEKRERMLRAFENPSTIPRELFVSFAEGTTKEQANTVLEKFGLTIEEREICLNAVTVDPDGTSTTQGQQCYTEGWFENLTAGKVLVAAGQEKTIAEQLYDDPAIIWVEPNYTAQIAGPGGSTGSTNPNDTANPPTDNGPIAPSPNAGPQTNDTALWWVVGGLIALGIIGYALAKKK